MHSNGTVNFQENDYWFTEIFLSLLLDYVNWKQYSSQRRVTKIPDHKLKGRRKWMKKESKEMTREERNGLIFNLSTSPIHVGSHFFTTIEKN